MAQVRIDFQGRGEVQTFSRARVQAMRDGVQLVLSVARQVGALGQLLAQQPVRVFIGAALPRAVRISKEHPDRRAALPGAHARPSLCPIVGQGVEQRSRHVPEFLRETLAGTPCIRPLHPCQEDQARGPLYQNPDGRPLRTPLIRSPSQWPGTVRVATLAGHSVIGVIWGIWPRRSPPPAPEVGAPCAPDVAPPTVRCAGLRGQHI